MSKRLHLRFAGPLGAILAAAPLFGQVPAKSSPATASSTAVEHAIDLAAKGRCQEALPVLKKSLAQASDKQLEYRVAMATARCAMSLDQAQTAVNALWTLKRDFPKDPEVLYIITHYFSQLATRAAQEMAAVAPTSYQAHALEAESLESRENRDAAANEYRKILEQNPNPPRMHRATTSLPWRMHAPGVKRTRCARWPYNSKSPKRIRAGSGRSRSVRAALYRKRKPRSNCD